MQARPKRTPIVEMERHVVKSPIKIVEMERHHVIESRIERDEEQEVR